MGFINDLLGNVDSNIWILTGGLAVTIVAILLVVWLLKVAFTASRNGFGGRAKRLAVINTAAVDNKRQLVIIRRDNKEHLLMIGGPNDLVIETGIDPEETIDQKVPAKRQAVIEKPAPVKATPTKAEPKPEPVMAQESAQPKSVSREPRITPAPKLIKSTAQETPVKEPQPNVPAINKLRELGQSSPDATTSTLRYPGILRPVTRHKGVDSDSLEQNNDDHPADSDKLSVVEAPEVESVQGADGDVDKVAKKPVRRSRKPAAKGKSTS